MWTWNVFVNCGNIFLLPVIREGEKKYVRFFDDEPQLNIIKPTKTLGDSFIFISPLKKR